MRALRTSNAQPRATAYTVRRPRWQLILGVLLMFTTLAQSVLTAACGVDEFASKASGDTTLVVTLPASFGGTDSATLQDTCVACGGLVTMGGCCPHGVPLSPRIPELSVAKLRPVAPAVVAAALPQDSPPDLFRPPILV